MEFRDGHEYREILIAEFQKRKTKNPRYSMRAFARDIGLTSARLTEVLKKRQGLSRSVALAIGKKMSFNSAKLDFFCNAVEAVDGRSKLSREMARKQVQKFGALFKRRLNEDQFKIISEWYHFAILSMTNLISFQSSTVWIANRLGIDVMTAEAAVERLKRLGYLTESNGKLSESSNFVAFQEDIPSEWGQKFHKQIIEKAAQSVQGQSVHKRDLSALTLAINPDKIPLAKKMIADFVREFDKEMSLETEFQSLYCLSVQFFSLEQVEGDNHGAT